MSNSNECSNSNIWKRPLQCSYQTQYQTMKLVLKLSIPSSIISGLNWENLKHIKLQPNLPVCLQKIELHLIKCNSLKFSKICDDPLGKHLKQVQLHGTLACKYQRWGAGYQSNQKLLHHYQYVKNQLQFVSSFIRYSRF